MYKCAPIAGGVSSLLFAGLTLFALISCTPEPSSDVSPSPSATPIIVSTTTSTTPSSTPSASPGKLPGKEQCQLLVQSAIEKTGEKFPGHPGIYVIDIDSNLTAGLNEEAVFESASLMKLVVIAELYRQIQIGTHSLDENLALEEDQKVGGSGDLKELKAGTTLQLETIATKMIAQSDNTATQMLTDLMGKEAISESAKKMGLLKTKVGRDIYDFAAIDKGFDNLTSPKDTAHLLQLLARQQLPGSEAIHSILEKQQRNDMIGKNFPRELRFAHKTGELNGVLHDAGIIYTPRGALVVVMLSDRVENKKLAVQLWSELALEIVEIYANETSSPSPPAATNGR